MSWDAASAVASVGLLAGCLNYAPQELSTMSVTDLCEMQTVYRANLSEESRNRVTSELQRRNEDCRAQADAIASRRAEFLYDKTYRNQSP